MRRMAKGARDARCEGAMAPHPNLQRCPECGVAVPPTPREVPAPRIGCLSLLRVVPAGLVLLAIALLLYHGGEANTSNRSGMGVPGLLEPAITAADLGAIGDGQADAATLERWDAALHDLLASRSNLAQRRAFVCAGFIEPPAHRREDWSFGWPAPWAWAVRFVARDDSIGETEPRSSDQPFQYFPPIPRKPLDVLGSSLLPWTYVLASDGTQEWRLDPTAIRWDEARPSPPSQRSARRGTQPPQPPAPRSSALLISNWSIPILAGLLAWRLLAAVPAFRPRWRRALLLLAAFAALVPFLSRVSPLLDRGWRPSSVPSSGWVDAAAMPPFTLGPAPLGPWLHRDEIARAAETMEGQRALASFLAANATRPTSQRPLYLVLGFGGPWQQETWTWRSTSVSGFFLTSTVDVDMPAAVEPLDAAAGPLIRSRPQGGIELAWRRTKPGEPSYRLTADLGPLAWFILLVLIAWSLPAAIVRSLLHRRDRRRFRRGRCPACTHPLTPVQPSQASDASV